MNIQNFLKYHRKRLGISQEDLASRLTLRGQATLRASVGHWEKGRNDPPLKDPSFRQALAAALEIDVNTMMTELGFVTIEGEHSSEARRAAEIVDRLPENARDLALGYLVLLEEHFVNTN